MLGVDELRRFTVDLGTRINQVLGIQLVSAVVALIAAGVIGATDRTGALDVTIREGTARGRADGTAGGLSDHVAIVVQAGEELLHDRVVVAGGGAGEQVIRKAEAREVLDDDAIVAIRQFLDGRAFLLRLHQQRGAVLVGARNHEHLVASHSLKTRENVRRHTESGDVADVAGAVSVGPCN